MSILETVMVYFRQSGNISAGYVTRSKPALLPFQIRHSLFDVAQILISLCHLNCLNLRDEAALLINITFKY